jgi:hypothetical protein
VKGLLKLLGVSTDHDGQHQAADNSAHQGQHRPGKHGARPGRHTAKPAKPTK